MTEKDFNLLDEIEQIQKRENANLKTIEKIQSTNNTSTKDLLTLRRHSLKMLETVEEIRDRAEREGANL